jgi:hypothetical protein
MPGWNLMLIFWHRRPRVQVKETVGERAAEALMEKEEQQRQFNALVGKAIGVVVPVAL